MEETLVQEMTTCALCGKEMPQERKEFGLHLCAACTDQTKPMGVMEYGHKTAGYLVLTDRAGWLQLRKPANARR